MWTSRLWQVIGIGATGALAGTLGLAVMDLPRVSAGLTTEVAAQMDRSGVDHPVTAVLLNFRGYDTWLETGVLLFALLSILALRRSYRLDDSLASTPTSPVLTLPVKVLTPAVFVASGYLLWNGAHAPGGAFQAGAVLGAALVLLQLSGYGRWPSAATWQGRAAPALGFALFLSVGLWTTAQGVRLLEYPLSWAGAMMVLIEVGVALATAVTLAGLYSGNDLMHSQDDSPEPTTEGSGRGVN